MNDILALPVWLPYKLEPKPDGKKKKPPYNPATGKKFPAWNQPGQQVTYDEAIAAVDKFNLDGVGFLIPDGFFVLDIDGVDPTDNRVQEAIRRLDSYSEFSPSGQGVHIICKGDIPITGRKRAPWKAPNGLHLEGYTGYDKRYMTFTDNPIEPGMSIEERTTEIIAFLEDYGGLPSKKKPSIKPASDGTARENHPHLSDSDLLSIARKAKNGSGEKFSALYDQGELSTYDNDPSRADLALCGMLAFYCQGDISQIDRLFRESKLYREKWEEKRSNSTYGIITIGKAIDNLNGKFFTPKTTINTGGDSPTPAKLIPNDFTHVGEAEILAREYGNRLRYSAQTGFLTFNGKLWEDIQAKSKAVVQRLTTRQLKEARAMVKAAPHKSPEKEFAESYEKHAKQCRFNGTVNGILSQAEPMVLISVNELDGDPFLLNTPTGTFDMRTGNMKKHDPTDYITKITAVSPSLEGIDVFKDFMQTITCGDYAFAEYLQLVCGMAAIGKVFHEHLVIAHGKGANGKSTLFNTIGRVMGDYYGTLPPESLLANTKGTKDYSYAELRGKRLIVAAETEEGRRLSESSLKRIASKDPIHAEKKFKDPFRFEPSHSTILYTNFLPNVGSLDHGTWRRLVVLPFNHKFEGNGDKKDYADYLYKTAGGAILAWIIQGAKRFIAADFKADPPPCVIEAVNAYRADNDWISTFIEECCELGAYQEKAGELYARYREYAKEKGEFARKDSDFKNTLSEAGVQWKRLKTGIVYAGIKLKPRPTPSQWGTPPPPNEENPFLDPP